MSVLNTTMCPEQKTSREFEKRRIFEEKQKLIIEVKKRRALWDKTIPQYKDRVLVRSHWQEIAKILNVDVDLCKRQWKNLFDQFRHNYYLVLKWNKRDDGVVDLVNSSIKWVFFKRLLFLQKVIGRSADNVSYIEDDNPVELEHNNCSASSSICVISEVLGSNSRSEQPIVNTVHQPAQDYRIQESVTPQADLKFLTLHGNVLQQQPSKFQHQEHSDSNKVSLIQQQQSKSTLSEFDNAQSVASAFGNYVTELIKNIPPHLQRRCEMSIMEVLHTYLEGQIPMIVKQETISKPEEIH